MQKSAILAVLLCSASTVALAATPGSGFGFGFGGGQRGGAGARLPITIPANITIPAGVPIPANLPIPSTINKPVNPPPGIIVPAVMTLTLPDGRVITVNH